MRSNQLGNIQQVSKRIRDAGTAVNFLQQGDLKPRLATRRHYALYAAAPLLDEPEFMKHATDDAVTQFENPSLKSNMPPTLGALRP